MDFEVPYDLEQAIINRNLIIFTGAGISRKEGLPSWKELVLKVLLDKENQIENSPAYADALKSGIMSPLDVLDKLEGSSKKHIFDVFEAALIGDVKSEFINNLYKISTKYITTNFDSLLEQNTHCKKITKDNNYKLSKIDNEDSYVLKIHGDIETIDSCVMFTKQYESLYTVSNLATFQLKKLFSQYTVLFIGFSFSDPYVSELFSRLATILDGLGPEHYIISTEKIDRLNLNDIIIKDHSELDLYINNLVAIKGLNVKVDVPSIAPQDKSEKIVQIDGSDLAPYVTNWVGREKEIAALKNTFKVFFITGIGGQGKSALAAHFLEIIRGPQEFHIFDWRDFKEENHKFQEKIISMIMLVKNENDMRKKYTAFDDRKLIDIFFDSLGEKSAVFVLDNVDSYIDLEEFEPLNGIGELFNQALVRNHKSKFIFTCRPFVRYASVDFYQLSLGGLGKEDVITYFDNSNLPINENKAIKYAVRAYELTRGHPLWISLILAQAKRGEGELEKLLNGISQNEITEEDSSSIMSDMILGKIWPILSPNHKLVLRSLAESVNSLTVEDFFEIVSNDITYNKFGKSFRAVKNFGLIIEKTGGKYVELHPLVKEYIMKKFPREERAKFIYMLIKYYDKFVLVLKPKLSNNLSFSDFQNWTHKIELFTNAKDYQKALEALHEIHDAIKSAGYIEEYIRVSNILFKNISWNKHKINKFILFDTVYLNTILSSTEYGDIELSRYLLENYETTVDSKDSSFITLSSAQAQFLWFNKDYKKAIDICEKATYLLKVAKQPENARLKNYYALALRDSGDPENMRKSLDILLEGHDLPVISDNNSFDESLGGTVYGNVGRCLQLMSEFEKSLNCLSKSFMQIYSGDSGDRLLNLGYASAWLSEVLILNDDVEVACYFHKMSLDKWENTSPPLFYEYKTKTKTIFNESSATIKSIISTEPWRVEEYCHEWARKRVC